MTDLPKIGKPAIRALARMGVTRLEELAAWSEDDLLALHGVGPRAIALLAPAMAAHGVRFAARKNREAPGSS